MDSFAISDLQRFSGIKSHTIRMWEQRYNALQPERSEGNTRYYNSNQLRRLLNLVSLLHAGYKISEVSKMTDPQLNKLLIEVSKNSDTQSPQHEYFISQMIRAGLEFNEEHLEKVFFSCMLRFGFKETYLKVLYPMLVRIGMMWATEQIPPAQEHFVSNIVRQKLLTGTDALPPSTSNDDLWILYLPEDEFHEIGLLFSNFLIRQSGKKVIYLGASTSFETLKAAIQVTKPTHLLFFITHHNDPELTQEYLTKLSKSFPAIDINFAGNGKLLSGISLNKKLNWIKSPDDLEQKINSTVV